MPQWVASEKVIQTGENLDDGLWLLFTITMLAI